MIDEYYLLKITDPELIKSIEENSETPLVIMTEDQYREVLHTAVRNTVHRTLVEVGFKATSFRSGKIYRSDMIKVIGVRAFNDAREKGHLKVYKNNPTKRNSKVYAKRGEWDRFLKWNVNKKI